MWGDSIISGGNCSEECLLIHGGVQREIRSRRLEREALHAQLRCGQARELIDGCAAGREICQHLRRDFCGIGGDTLRGDPVIGGEDQDLDMIEAGWTSPLPTGKPGNEIFQSPASAWRFCKLRFAAAAW